MSSLRHILCHTLRVALLLLFISMQGFVLAHELDQSKVHDGSICAVCHSVGGNHDGIIASHTDCLIGFGEQVQAEDSPPVPHTESSLYTPEARAPPSSR